MEKSRRQVLLLACLFAVSGIGTVGIITVAAVTAIDLTGSIKLATLPVALSMLGGMLATVPLSHLMARRGRRTGFVVATTSAFFGASLAALAIHLQSFVLFCAGSFLVGVVGGAAQLYRFAAVDVSPPERHAKSIGFVLGGGVVAGIVGPIVAFQARDFWFDVPFAGSYVAMAILAIAVVLLLGFLEVPRPPSVARGTGRPLRQIARDYRFQAAVLASATAFVSMVMIMVAAPLSLRHIGHQEAIAYVIQAHVVAMYLPSFFTGALIGRIGSGRGMALGLTALATCTVVNLLGDSVTNHYVALVLLGIGWNLLFVSGTALLTKVPGPGEKATVQGVNDFFVAGVGASAALGAGALHGAQGWAGLNLVALIWLAGAGVALFWLLGRSRSSAPAISIPAN